ncbi:MAG TPA: hypothetical protein DDZ51_08800 [Planctomycetaceae bacterium]|nr:hypothetical protein [Planctomycetaceae bacterium]
MDERQRPLVDNDVGVLAVDGGRHPVAITQLRVLGHGRAAEARLVRATDRDGYEYLSVEKVFRPGWLTRTIYRAAFQSPFAYQDNRDAICASFYRRRVAAAIIKAFAPEARVAMPLYVRWDAQSQAMVLASEFIRGRGVTPAPVDSKMLRRRIAGLYSKSETPDEAPAEIDQLVGLMTKLESLLVDSGMTGSGWQVCKRAMVSTANLLRTETGYVVVDLESGIPSVLVPSYIAAGIKLHSLPLFDDLNPARLTSWIDEHHTQLQAVLSPSESDQLHRDVTRLIEHDANWKQAETAILRRPMRLLKSDFRDRYKARVLESWSRRDVADPTVIESMRNGGRFFTSLTFWFGLIPGRIGRFFQRYHANTQYRNAVKRFVNHSQYRDQVVAEYVSSKVDQWKQDDRLPSDHLLSTMGASFVTNWALSKATPARLHRWLSDPAYRQQRQTRMFLFCVSGRFQRELGRLYIRTRVQVWQQEHRLNEAEAQRLNAQLDNHGVDEYVRGFGMHVGLKLLMPFVMSLKIGGAAASVASGNPFYFLFMLMLVPMLRTAITIWRKLATGRPLADYRDALIVGVLPVVGSIAYPVQMHCKFPDLSLFLLRDFASRIGRMLPIYGGKDSRTEIAAISSVNLVAEAMEVWSTTTRSNTSTVAQGETTFHDSGDRFAVHKATRKIGRWEKLVNQQLRLLEQEAGFESVYADQESQVRRAA